MKTKTKDKPLFQVRPALDIADSLKYNIVSDKKVGFSKKRAFEYLELATFQGERQVNERHVQFLYNAWVGGRFMWDHVIVALCECEGKRYRINGQHTAWMRVNLPDDYFIKRGEEPQIREVVYGVETPDQMRALYSTFDQNKSRTPNHVFRALVAGSKATGDLWPSVLGNLGAGLKMWLFKDDDKRLLSANDLAALCQGEHERLFQIVGLFYQSHYDHSSQFMRRVAVIAALFATFDKVGGKAPEFWDPVANGLNLTEKTDPRYALRTFLETHKLSSSHTSKEGSRSNSEDTYRVCLLAWNKWRKGVKVLQGLKTTDERQKVA